MRPSSSTPTTTSAGSVDAIEALGALDDTLVYVIVGDNGASAEGTLNGAFNEMANFNGMADLETTEFLVETMDKLGTPEAYNHYSVGWAHAMNTPYQWTKQVASHWGGTRNGSIVRWPKGIAARGEVRSQFSHVIDVCPTVLEAAGLPHPVMVNGVQQAPIVGTSMLYSFDDGEAPERHDLQYFDMFANRGIYHKGWSAVTKHRTPWVMGEAKLPAFDADVWELYDGSKDWSQAHDLAKEMPEKLHQLQRLWLIEATKYNVLPLDDRTAERLNADIAGRPQLVRGTSQMLFGGMGRLSESSVLNIKNKSFSVTAEVEVPAAGADGPIVAQGGRFGGSALYATGSRPVFVYNVLGLQLFVTEADEPLPAGTRLVRMEFDYDGGGLAKGGDVRLLCDGEQIGHGRVEATQPFYFSADETTEVGYEAGTAVSAEHTRDRFTGKVGWVRIELASDAGDHEVDPEHALKVAMSLQWGGRRDRLRLTGLGSRALPVGAARPGRTYAGCGAHGLHRCLAQRLRPRRSRAHELRASGHAGASWCASGRGLGGRPPRAPRSHPDAPGVCGPLEVAAARRVEGRAAATRGRGPRVWVQLRLPAGARPTAAPATSSALLESAARGLSRATGTATSCSSRWPARPVTRAARSTTSSRTRRSSRWP